MILATFFENTRCFNEACCIEVDHALVRIISVQLCGQHTGGCENQFSCQVRAPGVNPFIETVFITTLCRCC